MGSDGADACSWEDKPGQDVPGAIDDGCSYGFSRTYAGTNCSSLTLALALALALAPTLPLTLTLPQAPTARATRRSTRRWTWLGVGARVRVRD